MCAMVHMQRLKDNLGTSSPSVAYVLGLKCRSSGLHSKCLCPQLHPCDFVLGDRVYYAMTVLNLPTLLPQPLEYWDHRHA